MVAIKPVEDTDRTLPELSFLPDSAVSLACCSKFFTAVYNANKAAIATSILPRDPILNRTTMSFYEIAVDLFIAQKKAELGDGTW
jgi:hypothetical protein